ncbi:tribbles homolog 2 [Hydra vulgaris]|uniref:Tribbles homolog 2 n=1 Tax=Hydra vulgaris TaxID=6087 RepID=T2M8V7_HYDVU|nr:tribbles homolog 2 [Hydra vulgaris]
MNQRVHRTHTRFRTRNIEELKTISTKRSKRKHYTSSRSVQNQERIGIQLSNIQSNIITATKVENYILSEINPSNCLCKAYNTVKQKEFACRIVQINKFREFSSPYYIVGSHENINTINEVVINERYAYVMFEKSFGDLHSYIRLKKKLKEEETHRLFKQIANVVKHCHSIGLALRDLKLRKFVFKDIERTQLMLETLDDAHIIINNSDILFDKHGCPAYVSPEILESSNGYSSKAADIWSLGVMLYTMLCGRYPFHDQDPVVLFNKIKHGVYMICEPISPKSRCLIHSILRKNPLERLTAEELLEHPWFETGTENISQTRLDRKKSDQLVPDISGFLS